MGCIKTPIEISIGCTCSISTDISTGTSTSQTVRNYVVAKANERHVFSGNFPFGKTKGPKEVFPFTFAPKFPEIFSLNDKQPNQSSATNVFSEHCPFLSIQYIGTVEFHKDALFIVALPPGYRAG